jgi:hypothetical protein
MRDDTKHKGADVNESTSCVLTLNEGSHRLTYIKRDMGIVLVVNAMS